MKKLSSRKPLRVSSETVRPLQHGLLPRVGGGAASMIPCTSVDSHCGSYAGVTCPLTTVCPRPTEF